MNLLRTLPFNSLTRAAIFVSQSDEGAVDVFDALLPPTEIGFELVALGGCSSLLVVL